MHITSQAWEHHRARWTAIGAAVAVSLGAGGLGLAHATSPDGAAAYVATEPCRLLDTRPDPAFHIGPFGTLQPNNAIAVTARGDVGECSGSTAIPESATGLQLNITPVGASLPTDLRVYPGDGNPPNASSLNPAPGQPPIPNAVTVKLDADGKFSIFNFQGTVDVIVDVVGHYGDHHHDDRYPLAETVYTKAEVDAMLANLTVAITVGNGEGVGGSICSGSGIEIGVRDATGQFRDARFSFIVPEFGYGQIRSDGSVRNEGFASGVVSTLTAEHPETGKYCLVFTGTQPTQAQAESTVASVHMDN